MAIVRPYQPSDRDTVLGLAHRLTIGVAPWRDKEAVEEAVTGWIRDAIGGDGGGVLVAVVDDRVVGLVTVGERRHFAGEVDAYVGELVVDGGSEGRGIGTLLMAAAEQWGRERGLRHLTLETGAANRHAREFYAARGYQEEDVRLTKAL
ncbi:GNAT family N-acetyltransferase [Actinoplanes sp. Pm04-4]|uniref:GNAT family N-acetyltransferase n=1 Tax=Paractinoplanes pyxinae TaxID=2997416 RepID=A0ABT4AXK1_9ACTN|nr:GNAT family N-acetyltransferase [Actinoplanes pyxinae]MCY1138982.1 GNAT family N-acetyltransferase [Actinoplanes pyxinae]